MKELPRAIHGSLHQEAAVDDHVVIRLFYSNNTSYQPAIADIIQKFDVPISIILGSLGHVREVAFGSLVVTLPAHHKPEGEMIVSNILAYFQAHNISAEILGFIPSP